MERVGVSTQKRKDARDAKDSYLPTSFEAQLFLRREIKRPKDLASLRFCVKKNLPYFY